jgi:hypothetical protein
MSRTHRAHLSKGDQAKRGPTGQPKVRSYVGLAAVQATGGGIHEKTHKQRRGNERAKLRKEAMSDE